MGFALFVVGFLLAGLGTFAFIFAVNETQRLHIRADVALGRLVVCLVSFFVAAWCFKNAFIV